MSNWYDTSPVTVSTIEKAILLEDVIFSDPVSKLDVSGKFNIPILTPTMTAGVEVESKNRTPKVKIQSKALLETSDYTTTNYLVLKIPSYILFGFMSSLYESVLTGSIPAGTEFLVGFLGEDINNVRIIGLNKE